MSMPRFLTALLRKSIFSATSPGPIKAWGIDYLGWMGDGVTKPYAQSVWAYRCLQAWTKLAQQPVQAVDTAGNVVESGSVAFLAESPNADQDMAMLMEHTILDLGLAGYAYWRATAGGRGTAPIELRRQPAMYVRIDYNAFDPATGQVMYYNFSDGRGKYERVPAEEVIHFKLANPYDETMGLSPIRAAQLSIDADFSSREHNRYQMTNHGRVAGLLTFNDTVGAAGLKERKKLWDHLYGGPKNAGKTAIMDANAKYEPLAMTAKDMDWLEGSKLSREEICAAFGVPPIVVGIFDHATYSNYDAAMLALWQDCLIPLGSKITNTINHWLKGKAKTKETLRFDYSAVAVLQQMEQARIDRYLKLLSGGKVTPARAAEMVGIDLGDPHPAQAQVWVTFSETPYGETQEPAKGDGKETSEAEREQTGKAILADIRKTLVGMKAVEVETTAKAEADAEAARKLRKARGVSIMREAAPYERKLGNVMREFFARQSRTIMSNAERLIKQEQKAHVEKAKEKTPEELADELLGDTNWTAALQDAVRPTLQAAIKRGAQAWLTETGLPLSRWSDSVGMSFLKGQLELIGEVGDYTREALITAMPTLAEGIAAGKSPESLMRDLEGAMSGITDNTEERRQRIARTESGRAINGGRFSEMKAVGVRFKEWLSVGDGDVRETHQDYDETVIPIDAEFAPGLAFPGDPRADGAETINCRCTLVAAEEGD